jgi:hypothetical protein
MFLHGFTSSLHNIMEEFETFCQTHDDDTVAWELVNSNLASLYGTTFKIPGLDDGSYAYLTFSYNDIVKGSTYNSWYRSTFNYLSEGYNHASIIYNRDADVPDIFYSSGCFVSFNVHKQYSEDLYMCEQGGGYKPNSANYNLLENRAYYPANPGSETYFKPPLYPNTGFPMLCMSTANSNISDKIEYYFTRNDLSATIVININGYYQSISFGLFDSIDKYSYKFPAYICGGSNGLYPCMWIYTPLHSSYNTSIYGNMINFDITQKYLSNTNMLYPCSIDECSTNFLVMLPDGRWDYFYNLYQSLAKVVNNSNNSTSYGLNNGLPIYESTNNCVFPTCSNTSNMVSRITTMNTENSDFMLFPIIPCCYNTLGMLGSLHNLYMIVGDNLYSGEITIGGHKYLIVPNGTDNRLLYYVSHIGEFSEWKDNDLLNIYSEMLNNKFKKLAIKLE